jgi:hypothetical protein
MLIETSWCPGQDSATYRQLLGNNLVNIFPREPTRATIGRLLLGNGSVNTPKTIRDNRRRCFPWGPPRVYITRSSKGAEVVVRSWETSVEEEIIWSVIGSSSGDVSRRWLRRNVKKWIRLCEEEFICDLSQSQSQSQSYFTTGGLLPISSPWCQVPWDPRPVFFNWTLAVIVLM